MNKNNQPLPHHDRQNQSRRVKQSACRAKIIWTGKLSYDDRARLLKGQPSRFNQPFDANVSVMEMDSYDRHDWGRNRDFKYLRIIITKS